MAVCSQIHTKHVNTLFGQNVQFLRSTCYVKNMLYVGDVSGIG